MFSFNDGVVARATSGARDIITASSVSDRTCTPELENVEDLGDMWKMANSGEKFLHCSGPTDTFVAV